MYAIEFQTTIKNNMIEIPEAYRDRLQQRVRVIVLADEKPEGVEALSIADVLAAAPGQRVFKTAESVHLYLQEERDSWDS